MGSRKSPKITPQKQVEIPMPDDPNSLVAQQDAAKRAKKRKGGGALLYTASLGQESPLGNAQSQLT